MPVTCPGAKRHREASYQAPLEGQGCVVEARAMPRSPEAGLWPQQELPEEAGQRLLALFFEGALDSPKGNPAL